MSNELMKVFENKELGKIRCLMVGDEPWFILVDVCKMLDLGNPSMVATRLDSRSLSSTEVMENRGFGVHNVRHNLVNEAGLYECIFASRKSTAVQIKRWVFNEVLPAIRKTGSYSLENVQKPSYEIEDPIKRAERWIEEKKELLLLKAKVEQGRPKIEYYDKVIDSDELMPITQIAKDFGYSGKRMNQILKNMGIQYYKGGVWYLYQKYADKGYTQSRTYDIGDDRVNTSTYWTHLGRKFIYDELGKRKIFPNPEEAE